MKSKFEPDEGKGRKFKNFFCIEPDHYKNDIYIYGKWELNEFKRPLLKTLWSQSRKYNNKVSIQCGDDEAPVGCVAVAIGQILAYHKRPNTIVG